MKEMKLDLHKTDMNGLTPAFWLVVSELTEDFLNPTEQNYIDNINRVSKLDVRNKAILTLKVTEGISEDSSLTILEKMNNSAVLLGKQKFPFPSNTCSLLNFLDAIKMIGDLILFFITLKKSSKKILLGSPATMIMGL